jgi:starch phosphorylase
VSIADGGARDLERAVADLAERLPPPLAPLARLAYDYRWSWTAGGAAVFRDVDPMLWCRSDCNPRHLIEAIPPRRLAALARDPIYVARVAALARTLETRPPAATGPICAEHPVAYFCSEFAVHCSLPLYGGGLGVLAGDLLKAASDLALPMVGVGLLYREGYFHQRLDPAGWQHEYWVRTAFERLPAVRVHDADGEPLIVQLTLRRRLVRIQIWRVEVGRVPLYLLDTDHEDNHPIDRWITARLYIGDRHTRLAQYAVLGIGGMRALTALGIRPALVHLNEGHAALAGFERLRALRAAGRTVEDALADVRHSTVFTTHTPVAAGNEGYREDEIEPVLGNFLDELGMPRATFYDLGRMNPGDRGEAMSITPLALRTSRAANGVSRRHGAVARAMWQPLWRDRSVDDVPIDHVTNGVHTTSWMTEEVQRLLDRHLGATWRQRLDDPTLWARVDAIPSSEVWAARGALRDALVTYVRERSVRDRLGRGEAPDYVEQAARVFDPRVLTVGFARRVATYKRLSLLTRFAERGLRLLESPRPIQLVIAGKAHPQDHDAKHSLTTIFNAKASPVVGGRVAFLEDYDLHMAQRLIAGCDVWLNLPRPPLEASGTSGMKAALNGGLNLSVLDGWWPEAYDGANGWAITTPDADATTQDDHDAGMLLDLLENEVIPLFYERDADGVPQRWIARVKAALRTLIPRFAAERMLREYADHMYLPAGTAASQV